MQKATISAVRIVLSARNFPDQRISDKGSIVNELRKAKLGEARNDFRVTFQRRLRIVNYAKKMDAAGFVFGRIEFIHVCRGRE